jgi:hypothetical protein
MCKNPEMLTYDWTKNGGQVKTSTKGTWELDFVADKKASHGILALKPFLDVEHDIKGDLAGGAAPSIGRGFIWGHRTFRIVWVSKGHGIGEEPTESTDQVIEYDGQSITVREPQIARYNHQFPQ